MAARLSSLLPRFRLLTLIALVIVAAILIGGYARAIRSHHAEFGPVWKSYKGRVAEVQIARRGLGAFDVPRFLEPPLDRLPIPFFDQAAWRVFDHVVEISIDPPTAAAAPEIIANCPYLEVVHLYGIVPGEELLAALRMRSRLRTLSISDAPQLTDAVLDQLLSEQSQLEEFMIRECPGVSQAGLAALAQHSKLVHLVVIRSAPRGDWIRHLQGQKLTTLSLVGVHVTAADLASIGKLTTLHTLHLNTAGLTDADLAPLSSLTQLEHLYLPDNPLTDAALPAIFRLRALRSLNLDGTKITQRGLGLQRLPPRLRDVRLGGTTITAAQLVPSTKPSSPDEIPATPAAEPAP